MIKHRQHCRNYLAYCLILISLSGCQPKQGKINETTVKPEGKLYIIGGGARPGAMIREMIRLSGTDTAGYIAILPIASSEPDTSWYHASLQFSQMGVSNIFNFQCSDCGNVNQNYTDSLEAAALIYICGGDQNKFMEAVLNTPVHRSILNAYMNGAMIAGTSAGAAVMSRKMITGNEFLHPEYTGEFRTIEARNIAIGEGLGLLDNVIIDQHFIKRMRMNRLVSAAIENPGVTCIGIDESTAIIVDGDSIRVTGTSQVIVIRNPSREIKVRDGLLGSTGLELSVYLPGDRFQH